MKHPFEEILPAQEPAGRDKPVTASASPMTRRDIAGLVVAFPAFAIVSCGRLPGLNEKKSDAKTDAAACATGCDPSKALVGDAYFATSLAMAEEGGNGLVLSQAAQEAGSASKLPPSTQTLGEEGADNFIFTFDLQESGGSATGTSTSTSVVTTAMDESGMSTEAGGEEGGAMTTAPDPGESGGGITTDALNEEGGLGTTTALNEEGGAMTTAPDPGESGGGLTDALNEVGGLGTTNALNEEGGAPATTAADPGESGAAVTTATFESGGPATTAPEPGESGGALFLNRSNSNLYLDHANGTHPEPGSVPNTATTAAEPAESGGAVTNSLNEEGNPLTKAAIPSETGGSATTPTGSVDPQTVDGVNKPNEQQKQIITANAAVARETLGADYTSTSLAEEGGGNLVTSNAFGEEGGAGNEITSVMINEEGGDAYLTAEASQGWIAISRAISAINESVPPSKGLRFKLLIVRYKGKRVERGVNQRVYVILYSLKNPDGDFILRHVYVWPETISGIDFSDQLVESFGRRYGFT